MRDTEIPQLVVANGRNPAIAPKVAALRADTMR